MERTDDGQAGPAGEGLSLPLPGRVRTALLAASFACGAVVFLALAASVRAYAVDDAFIYYRTARNLAAGEGFAFNPRQRVEGVSSPLWVALLAAGEAAGVRGSKCAKLVSVACVLGVVPWLMWRALRGRWLALGATLLVWTCGAVVTWTVGGLETVFHAVLVLGLFVAASSAGGRLTPGVAVLSAALVASRPEGVLFPLAVVLHMAVAKRRVRPALALVGVVVAAAGALTAFRWAYFGALLPNTFDAKVAGSDAVLRAALGAYYVLVQLPWAWWLVGLAALWVMVGRRAWLAGLFLAAQGLFVLVAGGDWMPGGRFLLPAFPVAVVLAVAGAGRVCRGPRRAWAAAGLCACLGAVQAGDFALRQGPVLREYADGLARGPLAMGLWLRDHAAPGATVAARDVGALGYASGCRVIDLVGLTDRHVARTSGFYRREALDADYVFGQRPEFIVIDGASGDPAAPRPAAPSRVLFYDRRFAGYRHVGSWRFREGYWYHLFRREDGGQALGWALR